MKFAFTLILDIDPDDDQADALYGKFQDGTIATVACVARIDFHREADSLAEAIQSAIFDVRSQGIEVKKIEIEPAAVGSGTA
ncbi:MAG TPA: hypothetical protein VFI31_10960 [Pirellulales bacterium]|nr:hypothetical protein [Pirellulales bacterium]